MYRALEQGASGSLSPLGPGVADEVAHAVLQLRRHVLLAELDEVRVEVHADRVLRVLIQRREGFAGAAAHLHEEHLVLRLPGAPYS